MILSFTIVANWNVGPTLDEPIHLISGLDYTSGHNRINFEHPPLVKFLSALCVRLSGVKLRESIVKKYIDHPSRFNDRALTLSLFSSPERTMSIIRRARLAPLIFFLLLLFVTYKFSAELLSQNAGLMAMILVGLYPNTIAHAQLIHTDIPVTSMILLCAYISYRYYNSKKMIHLIILALSFALALLIKFSALLFSPLLLFIIAFTHAHHKFNFRKMFYHTIIFILISVSLVALFNGMVSMNNDKKENKSMLLKSMYLIPCEGVTRTKFIDNAMHLVNIPLIGTYCVGFYRVLLHNRYCGGMNYFMNNLYPKGNIFYFPLAFVVKSPVSLLIIILMTLWLYFKNLFNWRSLFMVVILYYLSFSLISTYNIGIRHILPIYPFIIIFSSSIILDINNSRRLKKIFYFLVGLFMIESVIAFPDYIEYFNFLIPEKKGQYMINDSNYDWGQKNYKLWKYSRDSGKPIACFVLAFMDPFLRDAQLGEIVPKYPITPGYYAIGSFVEALLHVYDKNGFKIYNDNRFRRLNKLGKLYAPNLKSIIKNGEVIKDFKSVKVYRLKTTIDSGNGEKIKTVEGKVTSKTMMNGHIAIKGYINTDLSIYRLYALPSNQNFAYALYKDLSKSEANRFYYKGEYSPIKREHNPNALKLIAVSLDGEVLQSTPLWRE